MNIIHRLVFESDDFSFARDPLSELLIIDDVIVLCGDWYHDHISDKIEGFLKALKFMKVEYVITEEKVNEDEENSSC